ncbi:hypothetical protein EVC37_22180 [Methylocaldum sp. BRCS4]|nr:hypothetical protein [Methylocaldum sp. BRCS4]
MWLSRCTVSTRARSNAGAAYSGPQRLRLRRSAHWCGKRFETHRQRRERVHYCRFSLGLGQSKEDFLMSLDILASGSLIRDPKVKLSQKGTAYTVALLSAAVEGEDRQIINVIAFGSVGEKLAMYRQGDAVSVTGPAKVGIYEKDGETKPSLSVTANAVLTAYDATVTDSGRKAIDGLTCTFPPICGKSSPSFWRTAPDNRRKHWYGGCRHTRGVIYDRASPEYGLRHERAA